jgi:guanosine-3',5'-bis(diphosphate) 3'-pyrophosphohydrolase
MFAQLLSGFLFAVVKHKDQTRNNAQNHPYMVHPIRVAQIITMLSDQGENVDLLLAAILHDTVEDTSATLEEIDTMFGTKVSRLVEEHTDDKTLEKLERKRLQIENAPRLSAEAKILVLADKIANLEDLLVYPNGAGMPLTHTVEKVQTYVAWAKQVCDAVEEGATDGASRGALQARVRELCGGTFQYMDGTEHPAMPTRIIN